MTCEETRSRLSAYLDSGRGAEVDREALTRHMGGCPSCRRELEAMADVDALVVAQRAPAVDAGARDRVLAGLSERLAKAERLGAKEARAAMARDEEALAVLRAEGEPAGAGRAGGGMEDDEIGRLSGVNEIRELAAATLAAASAAPSGSFTSTTTPAAALSKMSLAIPATAPRRNRWAMPMAAGMAGVILAGIGIGLYVQRSHEARGGGEEVALAPRVAEAAPVGSPSEVAAAPAGTPDVVAGKAAEKDGVAEPAAVTLALNEPAHGTMGGVLGGALGTGAASDRLGGGGFGGATGDHLERRAPARHASARASTPQQEVAMASAAVGSIQEAPAPAVRTTAGADSQTGHSSSLSGMIDEAGDNGPPPPAAAAPAAPPPPAPKTDDLDSLVAQSEAPSTPSAKKPALPAQLTSGEIKRGMEAVSGRAQACYEKYQVEGVLETAVRIAPDGSVASAIVEGPLHGTPTGKCVQAAARAAHFPAFSGPPMDLTYPFILRAD